MHNQCLEETPLPRVPQPGSGQVRQPECQWVMDKDTMVLTRMNSPQPQERRKTRCLNSTVGS